MSTLTLISLGRTLFGTASIIAPITTWSLFRIPLNAHGAILAETFGAREVALGILLFTTRNRLSSKTQATADGESTRKEEALGPLRTLLWTGMAVDSFDFVCCLGAYLAGTIDGVAFGMVGGAAAGLVGLQLLSLRGLAGEK